MPHLDAEVFQGSGRASLGRAGSRLDSVALRCEWVYRRAAQIGVPSGLRRRAVEVHLRSMVPSDATFRFRRADGFCRWIRSRGVFQRDWQGRPAMACGQVAGVTELRARVETLRISEARIQAFIDHCPTAAFLEDPAGRR